jgi:putative Holliday junction resolvase
MKRPASVLAIDHGEKRVGFAVADPLRIAAQALAGWRGSRGESGLLDHVESLLAERDVAVLLVGLPVNMDGSDGPRAAAVRGFAERLAARFPQQEVVLYDERLTTKAAEDLLRESGVPVAKRREQRDSASALVLLRDWLASGEPR